MARPLRIGLAVALALALTGAAGRAASADPTTPQLSPLHRQREDAQRLTEQQRHLDAPLPPAAPAAASSAAAPAEKRHTTRGTAVVLLGIAGISAIIAVPLLVASNLGEDPQDGSFAPVDTLSTLFVATSVVAGLGGIVFLIADRTVAVTPAVSPRAVGIAITGRL